MQDRVEEKQDGVYDMSYEALIFDCCDSEERGVFRRTKRIDP